MKREKMIIIGLIVGLILLLIFNINVTSEAIDKCIAGGNSKTYCENGLR